MEHANGLDDRWKNRIHIDFYGKGIDPEHDHELDPSAERSHIQQARDQAYYDYLDLVATARKELLSEHVFVHTANVVDQFRRHGVEAENTDIVTLRRWGYVLAVPDHERWLYPIFQFDQSTGLPSPIIKEVFDARNEGRESAPDEWATLSFWSDRAIALDGRTPRQLLWDETSHPKLRRYIDELRKRPMTNIDNDSKF